MGFWQRLSGLLGFHPPEHSIIRLDETLAGYVHSLAEQEQRSPDAVAADLLTSGLLHHSLAQETVMYWRSLSPREQQVAALVCLGYTNQQIAARLVLSPNTIKSHVGSILSKYKVRSRGELRMLLEDWDFSPWEK